jgi:hypothetical protein
MADHDYIQISKGAQLRNWILSEMMRGAGYAALVVVGIALVIWAIYLVGLLLPEDSKNAPPPMPFSQIEAPLVAAAERVA